MSDHAVDLYYDIPYEIIYDDKGRVIGEVYTLHQFAFPPARPPRRRIGK